MLDFVQKRKVRAILYHWATLIFLFVFVLFAIHSTWMVYSKKRESEVQKETALRNLTTLTARSTELDSKIEKLETPAGIEEEIRAKFNVAKEGESVVVIVPDQSKTATTTGPVGFWQKIWQILSP